MRLALAMNRTVRELERTMGHDEFCDWLLFHSLYDLPDGFIVAERVCSVVSSALGNQTEPGHFAPYYARDPKEKRILAARSAVAFAQSIVNSKRKHPRTRTTVEPPTATRGRSGG